ncbi:MAG TPA: DNA methylase [Candidatus Scybalocola faecavium]|nr:DNA methylase [Candidatus Scybalocola faecavium]
MPQKSQNSNQRTYIAIDLKSYYASLECVERGLDPLTTNLVVADVSRTEKTICLAVSPALKSYGLPGRPRLFQVSEKVNTINARRLSQAIQAKKAVRDPYGKWTFSGSSWNNQDLDKDPSLKLDYITAVPHMAHYLECSAKIYGIYLKYIAPEDIHVYSIDEVFIDATAYLDTYGQTAVELAQTMIKDVLDTTGITAAAGIGTNLYLAKVAMDIVAKHVSPDKNGVRIAQLDELSYRRLLWSHEPITDFWRVGHGYAKKLYENGLYTMGDIARCSIGKETDYYNEDLLYKLFGINAELLIDHAWGYEPCTMAAIKAYKPENNSIGSGQVLKCPYDFQKTRLIVREMTELLVLDLVDKGLVTDQITLTVGYDSKNLSLAEKKTYKGQIATDRYGRQVPKHAHGTKNLENYSSSSRQIAQAMDQLYEQIVDPGLFVRRVTITANRVISEREAKERQSCTQMELFPKSTESSFAQTDQQHDLEREKRMQKAILDIQKKFGKNALLKGMNLEEGAMTRERNNQIGGHRA